MWLSTTICGRSEATRSPKLLPFMPVVSAHPQLTPTCSLHREFALDKPRHGEPTSGLEPLTCSLRVCCYGVRVVLQRLQKPISKPIPS